MRWVGEQDLATDEPVGLGWSRCIVRADDGLKGNATGLGNQPSKLEPALDLPGVATAAPCRTHLGGRLALI